MTALKQIQDVAVITARHVHQKNITFRTSHPLFTTTNYVPVVNETDHGTWRRLELWKFPYTFRKLGEALHSDTDRAGDPTLSRHGSSTTPTTSTTPSSPGLLKVREVVRGSRHGAAADPQGQGRHSGLAG